MYESRQNGIPHLDPSDLFTKAFHASRDAMAVFTLDGQVLFDVNPSWCRGTGVSREQAIGQSLLPMWANPQEAEVFDKRIREAGRVRDFEFSYYQNGELRRAMLWADLVQVGGNSVVVAHGRDITEREKKKANLRLTEAQLEIQYRFAPIPTFIWERVEGDFLLSDYNLAAADFLGERATSLLGTSAADRYRDRPDIFAALEEAYRTRRPVQRIQPPAAGSGKHLSATYVFLPPNHVVVQAQDVSELREVEQLLSASENRYSMLLEDASEAVITVDADSRLVQCNAKFESLTGYARAECLGFPFAQFMHGDAAQQTAARTPAGAGGAEIEGERRLRRKDGSVLDAEISARKMADGTSVGIIRDITGRKEREEALRAAESRYRGLFDTAPMMIFEVSASGTILSLNPAFERITGWAAGDWIGRSYEELLAPESREKARQSHHRNLSGAPAVASEYTILKPDGQKVLLQVNTGISRENGAITRIFGFARDVTSIREAEENRRLLDQALAHSNRIHSLGRVAATVAHEFNQVLMSILPLAELMQRRNDPETVLKASLSIQRSIERGKRITGEILRFSNPSPARLRPVDAGAWLEEIKQHLGPSLGERIELELSCPAEPVILSVDPPRLEQVFANLLHNARDAMNGAGRIRVELVLPKADAPVQFLGLDLTRLAHFSISDRGAGIASSSLEHIFEPFFTTKERGTGLGLSVVYQIVEAHHGYIFVESTVGVGTTFHIFLPRMEGESGG